MNCSQRSLTIVDRNFQSTVGETKCLSTFLLWWRETMDQSLKGAVLSYGPALHNQLDVANERKNTDSSPLLPTFQGISYGVWYA